MFNKCAFLFFAFAAITMSPSTSLALSLFGNEVTIVEYAVTKSTSVRLVDVFLEDPLAEADATTRRTYLPAGTRIAITDYVYRDRQGDTWALSVTEDGLTVFLKTMKGAKPANNIIKSTDFEKYFLEGIDAIAVIQKNIDVESLVYKKKIGLTPSEKYAISSEDDQEGYVSIILDRDKMREEWTKNETIKISDENVTIISKEALRNNSQLMKPFLPYDPVNEAMSKFEDMLDKRRPDFQKLGRILINGLPLWD
ncbi:hypothetical protein [Rhizobium sp. FKL33]|uniref:hypothetical protein n=1 Tax=Rhizobium sp. FKL33 TaxID=2562307 RepID=UPI0010BFB1D1|nr:hypothetical protein [Rhizobium sp. FKL33]